MKWFRAQKTGDRKAKVTIDKIIASDWSPDWVVDFFGEQSAREFIEAVDALGDLDEITLEINSPGGDVYSGMRIHDYLLNHKATVHVVVSGLAASIASIIMLAGDTRTLRTGSKVMTHKPSTGLSGWFTADDLRAHADRVDEIESGLTEIYTSRTGKSEQEIRDLLASGDVYHNADQAIEWGFATHKDEKIQAVACVDEGVFRMQTEIHAALAMAKEAETEKLAAKADAEAKALQLTEVQARLDATATELESLKNPQAAPADDVISACAAAGLEALAVQMVQAKLPKQAIDQRIQLAGAVKDIAAASGFDASPLMTALGDTEQLLRLAITEARAAIDPETNNFHKPGTGTSAKTPNAARVYAQLNNLKSGE